MLIIPISSLLKRFISYHCYKINANKKNAKISKKVMIISAIIIERVKMKVFLNPKAFPKVSELAIQITTICRRSQIIP